MAVDELADQEALEPVEFAERKWPRPWQGPFLSALSRMPNVTAACRAAGIGYRHVYKVRDGDDEFRQAWADALSFGYDLMEQMAHRRATVGEEVRTVRTVRETDKEGNLVRETTTTEVRNEVSNTVLMRFLEAHRPERWSERLRHVGGDGESPVKVEVYRTPSPDRLQALLALELERARELEPPVIEGSHRPALPEET